MCESRRVGGDVVPQRAQGHLKNGDRPETCKAAAEARPAESVCLRSRSQSEGRVLLSAQASNIDDVLGHHTSFLDNSLKDSMLTNQELLKVFSRLMSVCVMFNNCMQVRPPHSPLASCHLSAGVLL